MRNPSCATSSSASTRRSKTPCCSKDGIKRGPWTPDEDEILASFVKKEGGGQWRTLPKRAGLLRCGKSCRLRWMNYLRPSIKRGRIAPDEEDLILRLHRLLGNRYTYIYAQHNYTSLPYFMKRALIVHLFVAFRWSLIAGRIPGRTDNEIKNYWNTHLSKKLISQGLDPRTHKPLNPNFPTCSPPPVVAYGNNSATDPNPKPDNPPNPNHNPSAGLEEEEGGGNPSDHVKFYQNPIADDGHVGSTNNNGGLGLRMGFESSHGPGSIESYRNELSNEDTLSLFLDSLIIEENGSAVNEVHHQQVVEPNVVNFPTSAAEATPLFNENWDDGGLWGAELQYAMATLGVDNDHQQSSTFNDINHTL